MCAGRISSFGHGKCGIVVLVLFLAPLLLGQAMSKVTAVDPTSGKVDDTVTLTGESLGAESVAAVFLSDDTQDFKATLVEQGNEKIVMRVPQTKPGDYNVSIQVNDRILILPLRFSVKQ
jgi:hypothetical protein